MPLVDILATTLFALLFALCKWRTDSLALFFAQHKYSFSTAENKRLVDSESRWRHYTHATAFLCLLPLPLGFLSSVVYATEFAQKSIGAAVVAAIFVVVVKLLLKVKYLTLFNSELNWKNLVALLSLGFAIGTLLAVLLAMALSPDLFSALVKQFKE